MDIVWAVVMMCYYGGCYSRSTSGEVWAISGNQDRCDHYIHDVRENTYIIQVFEWCQYMSLMEELKDDPHSLNQHPVIGEYVYVHSTSLTSQEIHLLEQFYRQLLPEYAACVLQYGQNRPENLAMCPYYPQETNTI